MDPSTQNSLVQMDGLDCRPRRRTVTLVAMIWALVATLDLGVGTSVGVFAATKRADELERAGALGTAIGRSYSDAENYVRGCRDDIERWLTTSSPHRAPMSLHAVRSTNSLPAAIIVPGL